MRPGHRWRVALLAALCASAACDLGGVGAGGGEGCFGIAIHQGDYSFPVKRIVKASAAGRLTQPGTELIAERIEELVLLFFEVDETGKAVIPLEDLGLGTLGTELGPFAAEVRDVVVTLDLSGLEVQILEGSSPAAIRVVVEDAAVGIQTATVAGALDLLLIEPDLACGMADGPDGHVALVSFSTIITLATTEDGALDLDVTVEDVQLHDVHVTVVTDCGLSECQDGCGECELVCAALDGLAELGSFLKDALAGVVDLLATFLADQLGSLLLDVLVNDQPLAVEGELDVGGLAGTLLPWVAGAPPLGVVVRPAGDAFAVTGSGSGLGVELILDAGVDASSAHPCIGDPGLEPVFEAAPLPTWPTTLPDGAPYHLGLALSEALVNEAVWVAWKSGLLCVDIDSGLLAQLTNGDLLLPAGALELLLPGISQLAGPDAPIRIRLRPRPTEFPVVRFGDPATGATLGAQLDDVVIDLDLLIGDHFLRLFGLEADLTLALDVVITDDTQLGLDIVALEVDDFDLVHDEIFAGARMDLILPLVLDLALGLLDEIELGLQLDLAATVGELLLGSPVVPTIREVAAEGEWLRLAVTLDEPPPPEERPDLTGATVELAEPGRVVVDLVGPPDVEVSFRAGGGVWGPWQAAADTVEVRHPRLWLLGPTWIDARTRPVGGGRPGPPERIANVTIVPPPPVGPAPDPAVSEAPTVGCGAASETPGGAVVLVLLVVLALVRRRRAAPLASLVVVLALLSGCTEGAVAPEQACEGHDQCPDDFFCHPDGFCHVAKACDGQADCCPGSVCFNGWCRPTTFCEADAECDTPGTVCQDALCAPSACATDAECPAPTRCQAGVCLTGLPCDGACTDEEACHLPSGRCLRVVDCFETCAPGTARVLTDDSPVTALECTGAGLDCACAELTPIAPGTPGFDGVLVDTAAGARHVSYDPAYGDLVVTDPATSVPVAVDGVPSDAAVVGATDGYRGGVAEPGPDRGRRPSAVAGGEASNAWLDILHRDTTEGTVRHTRVDVVTGQAVIGAALPVDGDAGRYSCITRDPATDQLLAFVFVSRDATDQVSRLLRLVALSEPPVSADDWGVQALVETPLPARAEVPCDGTCGLVDLCVRVGPEDDRCVSAFEGASCAGPCSAHHVCASVDGGEAACWPRVHADVADSLDALPWGRGLFVTCDALADGQVAVAWYDADNGALEAVVAPAGVGVPVLVDGTTEAGDGTDAGRHAALRQGPSGALHIAYQDTAAGAVRVATLGAGGTGDWVTEVVHAGDETAPAHDLGGWIGLTHDPVGEPVVTYLDATTQDVWLARRATCWSRVLVHGNGGWGWPSALAASDDAALVSAVRLSFGGVPLSPQHETTFTDVALPQSSCR